MTVDSVMLIGVEMALERQCGPEESVLNWDSEKILFLPPVSI